jgi:hypothetical protein
MVTKPRKKRADAGRTRIYTAAGELIRAPHATPQTVEVMWDRIPTVYRGFCNVAQCEQKSHMSTDKGVVQGWIASHHKVFHSEFHHPKEKKA